MTAATTTRQHRKPKSQVSTTMKESKEKEVTTTTTTTTGKVDRALVEKAVDALLKYHAKKTAESKTVPLLGTDATIQVQFSLEVAPENISMKPLRVLIPHPLQKVNKSSNDDDEGLEEPEVCLIVKEESKPWVQELLAKFPEEMGFIKKVLGLESLRKKYAQFSQRRELLHKYTMFLADDRILPMLTQALGRDFIKHKKQPVPIRITRKEALPIAIQKALSATFMFLSRGTCITIRAGNTGMPASKLVDNILAISGSYGNDGQMGAVYRIPRRWANVRSISIKTTDSTALPVYNKTPEELIEIAEMAGLKSVWKEPRKRKNQDDVKETTGSTKEKQEEEKKRKLDKAKSPLVRAIKKQKEQEKAQKKRQVDAKDEKDESPSKKAKKSKGLSKKSDEKGILETKSPAPKDKKEASVSKSSEKKAKKETATPKSSEKKAKKEAATPKPSEKKAKKEDSTPKSSEKKAKEAFVASKKFKGSKKGYIFQKGKEGLGYYVDSKPVVDRMAMEAFARAAKQNKKSPAGRRKSGGGGKRRGRR